MADPLWLYRLLLRAASRMTFTVDCLVQVRTASGNMRQAKSWRAVRDVWCCHLAFRF